MPAWPHMSLTSTPASACLRIETIWVSVNFDFFMAPPGWENMPESSTFVVSADQGSLRHRGPDPGGAHRNDDTELAQHAAHQVQCRRAFALELLADAVQRLDALLLGRLQRYGGNVRTTVGLQHPGHVGAVGLVAAHIGPHVPGGDQLHGVALGGQPAAPVM